MGKLTELLESLGVAPFERESYGEWAFKVNLDYKNHQKRRGRLVAVTAITPTERGEGKTSVSISLSDALNRAGHRTVVNLREPSMGPLFGAKGGAVGAGASCVIPEKRINMHFTGDIHALTYAANYIAAVIDNHIQSGNEVKLDPRRIYFKRCVDVNDRSLRSVVTGLGGRANGYVREAAFELTAASELTAILSLACSEEDLALRLSNVTIGEDSAGRLVRLSEICDIEVVEEILRDAFVPNFVMTRGGSPAFVHGASFANVAHGCASVRASEAALALGEIVIEEAGFGADLGFEKFMDIKCRTMGLFPDSVVMVVTRSAIERYGKECLKKHMENLKKHFNVTPIVVINKFKEDDEEDLQKISSLIEEYSPCVSSPFEGDSSVLAKRLLEDLEKGKKAFHEAYCENLPIKEKIEFLAKNIYGAKEVSYTSRAKRMIEKSEEFSRFPVCFAKTPLSFSSDKNEKNAGSMGGFTLPVDEVEIKSGARFIVAKCPGVFTLPGLPKDARR